MKVPARILVLLFLVLVAHKAQATCGATTFQPISPFIPPGTTHNAYFLDDPSGAQRAIFDLEWGGALASLKQSGAERVWGNAVGGMVQPAWHTFSTPTGQDYNPTLAGSNPNVGSVVLGVRCVDANTLFILSSVLDYNRGQSGYIVANAVKNAAVVANTFVSPYVVATTARFVPNPLGSPTYYLKLEQTITNTHPTESFIFGFEIAGYVPYGYTSTIRYPANCTPSAPCPSESTPILLGGLYPSASLTNGTAFLLFPQDSWAIGTKTFVDFGTDNVNQNQSAHLFGSLWRLGPGRARTVVWYVLVGSWSNALGFGQQAGGATFNTTTPCRVFDSRNEGSALASGVTRSVAISGGCGIPTTALAVSINATAVDSSASGTVSIGVPGGPALGTIDVRPGVTRSNNAILKVSPDGLLAVRPSIDGNGSVHIIIDINGWFQ